MWNREQLHEFIVDDAMGTWEEVENVIAISREGGVDRQQILGRLSCCPPHAKAMTALFDMLWPEGNWDE